jgi:hypothetical protein
VQRRLFRQKRVGVTGGWKKIHKENLYKLHSSLSIIGVIKSRRMIYVAHVARMREKRYAYNILMGNREGKRLLERSIRVWIILR